MHALTPDLISVGATMFVVFLFSTTCHEAAHALVAKLGGDPTAYHGGQVTLNPWPHIRREPVGMVIVPLLMLFTSGSLLGWASAPYDPYWAERHPRRAGLMAAAGPAANFSIALIAAALLRVGIAMGWLDPGSFLGDNALSVAQLLWVAVWLNMLLGTFNLLPLPPLDGATVLIGFGPESIKNGMRWLFNGPGGSFIGLFLAWTIMPRFVPLIEFGARLLIGR